MSGRPATCSTGDGALAASGLTSRRRRGRTGRRAPRGRSTAPSATGSSQKVTSSSPAATSGEELAGVVGLAEQDLDAGPLDVEAAQRRRAASGCRRSGRCRPGAAPLAGDDGPHVGLGQRAAGPARCGRAASSASPASVRPQRAGARPAGRRPGRRPPARGRRSAGSPPTACSRASSAARLIVPCVGDGHEGDEVPQLQTTPVGHGRHPKHQQR